MNFPEGVSNEAWDALSQLGPTRLRNNLQFNTFTGSDIRPLLYMPPNPDVEDTKKRFGYFQEFGNLQTITISSHRPAAPVRRLGHANAKWVRSVRTFAGSMIFNRLETDAFLQAYGRTDLEKSDDVPFFIDQVPPFHVLLHARNEMGMRASAAILNITITDFGDAYTIEDLVPEVTYSYVAEWVHPFMDRDHWRRQVRDAVSWLDDQGQPKASDLMPDDAKNDVMTDFPYDEHLGLSL